MSTHLGHEPIRQSTNVDCPTADEVERKSLRKEYQAGRTLGQQSGSTQSRPKNMNVPLRLRTHPRGTSSQVKLPQVEKWAGSDKHDRPNTDYP